MQNRGTLPSVEGVEVTGAINPGYEEILTPDALGFVASLARAFEGRRQELLARPEVAALRASGEERIEQQMLGGTFDESGAER